MRMSSSLSIYVPGGELRLGKFNFGVVTGEGRVDLVVMEVWMQIVGCLCRSRSLYQNFN